MNDLPGKTIRELRSRGQLLRPAVTIGQAGLTSAVLAEIDTALETHGLVKIKLGELTGKARKHFAERLAHTAQAHLVGVTGRTALLFRPAAEEAPRDA
jgi:RNA-binding protein